MNTEQLKEPYVDDLIADRGQATATGLSAVLEGQCSHDQITRMLSGDDYTSKDLWKAVKKTPRQVERGDACLIFDGTIVENHGRMKTRSSAGTLIIAGAAR